MWSIWNVYFILKFIFQVDQFRAGKKKILNFLIGQVQKELSGRADVKKVNMIMMKKLKQNW